MVHPWIVSSEKLKAETGYCFKYTSGEAFADFVRSVRPEKQKITGPSVPFQS